MTDPKREAEVAAREEFAKKHPVNDEVPGVLREAFFTLYFDGWMAALTARDEVPAATEWTDARIDHVADLVVKGMPDGLRGFCKVWGWQQFARALLDVVAPQVPPEPPQSAARWVETRLVSLEWPVQMSLGYDWESWELCRLEMHTPAASFAIWPDRIGGKRWSIYCTANGLLKLETYTEQTAKAECEMLAESLAATTPPQPRAEEVATVPWPKVTRYSGGASPEGIAGRVWLQLGDDPEETEYIRTRPDAVPAPAGGEREGWKLVPEVPTPEMIEAAKKGPADYHFRDIDDQVNAAICRAIAAAPAAQVQADAGAVTDEPELSDDDITALWKTWCSAEETLTIIEFGRACIAAARKEPTC